MAKFRVTFYEATAIEVEAADATEALDEAWMSLTHPVETGTYDHEVEEVEA